MGPMSRDHDDDPELRLHSIAVADFHAVSHWDGEGQICPIHDHLQRWHEPEALSGTPVFHIHWAFLPYSTCLPAADSSAPESDAPDPLDTELDDSLLELTIAVSMQRIERVSEVPISNDLISHANSDDACRAMMASRVLIGQNFAATFPPNLPAAALLQRWIC